MFKWTWKGSRTYMVATQKSLALQAHLFNCLHIPQWESQGHRVEDRIYLPPPHLPTSHHSSPCTNKYTHCFISTDVNKLFTAKQPNQKAASLLQSSQPTTLSLSLIQPSFLHPPGFGTLLSSPWISAISLWLVFSLPDPPPVHRWHCLWTQIWSCYSPA